VSPRAFDDLDPRTPVVAGVGVATQDIDEPGRGVDAATLMTTAAQQAGADSGSDAILAALQQVAVPAGTWSYPDPGRIVADRVGAAGARTVLVQVGIPQQTLFDDAYHAIRAGTIDVALVVGGEAARRATLARRAGVEVPELEQGDVAPDEVQLPKTEIITRLEIEGGIASAMAPFALIDSALRYAEGKSLDEHRDEIARLYAGFSEVAATFPHAAFPEPRTETFLREPSEANRPFSFPYNKWHCAQMNVDQAAAILICSADAARRLGVDPARVVHPVVALESSLFVPVSRRRHLHRWPAMEVLGAAAEAHLGFPLSAIASVEIYSCFPAAVRVQQRALGLPIDGVPTITGGEAFAGGPWNNFVLQTTAAMVDRIRDREEPYGLVTALSGLMNKPGLAVYATEPPEEPALVADLVHEATRATETVDVVSGHQGSAVIAACTAAYDGLEPVRCTVIADTPTGERCIATAHDADVARAATTEELIGRTITVDGNQFTL
jgi:acetyl-CoA C-acetyltransferase